MTDVLLKLFSISAIRPDQQQRIKGSMVHASDLLAEGLLEAIGNYTATQSLFQTRAGMLAAVLHCHQSREFMRLCILGPHMSMRLMCWCMHMVYTDGSCLKQVS